MNTSKENHHQTEESTNADHGYQGQKAFRGGTDARDRIRHL